MHPISKYLVRSLVVLYLLAVLVVAGGLALQAWPDNPLRQRLYVIEAERIAALHVTAESISSLNRALAILANLPEADLAKRPSRADLAFLLEQRAFADAILKTLGNRQTDPAPEPNPARWERRTVAVASERLIGARQKLEQRALSLVPSKLDSKPFVILCRTFAVPQKLAFEPALTASEQARVSLLLSERNRAPSDTAATSVIDQKLRPVLAQIQDADFILLVIALGAWGAAAQALASIADYFGTNRYSDRWAIFYLTRPPIGATLAFTFYIIFRGGLLSRDAAWESVNHIGYAAISVLVGFFSNEALANLKRIASGIFADKEDHEGLKAKQPLVSSLKWSVTSAADLLEISGGNFGPATQVIVNGVAATQGIKLTGTTLISCDAQLLRLKAGDLLQLLDPGAGAKLSPPQPVPALPTRPALVSAQLDATKATLTLTGRRFPTPPSVIINNALTTTPPTSASSGSIIFSLSGAQPLKVNKGDLVCVLAAIPGDQPTNLVAV